MELRGTALLGLKKYEVTKNVLDLIRFQVFKNILRIDKSFLLTINIMKNSYQTFALLDFGGR